MGVNEQSKKKLYLPFQDRTGDSAIESVVKVPGKAVDRNPNSYKILTFVQICRKNPTQAAICVILKMLLYIVERSENVVFFQSYE